MISCKLSHAAFINWSWLDNKPPYPDRRFDLGSGPSPQSRRTDPMQCFAKKHKRWNSYFNNVSSPPRSRHSHPGSHGFSWGSFGKSRLARGRKIQRLLPAFLLLMSSSWPQVFSRAAMFASQQSHRGLSLRACVHTACAHGCGLASGIRGSLGAHWQQEHFRFV